MRATRILWIDLRTRPTRDSLAVYAAAAFDVATADRFDQVPKAVRQFRPHLACVEFDYPDAARLRIVPLLREASPVLGTIVFTDYHSEALAVWAFRSGVWDYRVKPVSVDTLRRSISVAVETARTHGAAAVRRRPLPADLIEPAGHLRRPPAVAKKTDLAVAHISDHYAEPLRHCHLATLCNLSGSEFSRTFRREQGVTFQRFLLQYRIAKAREMLAQPNAPVSQVAYSVGFNDPAYFSRVFREQVGTCALDYQRGLRRLLSRESA